MVRPELTRPPVRHKFTEKQSSMISPILAVSRRTRRTPFTPRVESLGVIGYTVYNHTLLPTAFRSVEEDYAHLKRHVQIWDVGCERQVQIVGPDAAKLTQLMSVRDLSKAQVGQCLYAPLCDEDGGLVNDPIVLKLAEDQFWMSIADSDVLLWARGLAYGMRLDVEISEPDVWPLAVQGPKSDDLMAAVFGDTVRDIRFFRFETLPFKGQPMVIARSGWSKQGGFEIYLNDPELALDLWDTLWDAGKHLEVGPGCPNLIERIEGGLLSYGNDMTRLENPLECGLDKYCHHDREIEFIARDALLRISGEGVTRKIRGLKIEGDPLPGCVTPWRVHRDGLPIGRVTSAIFSPGFASNIAFAMIDQAAWDTGEVVQVVTPDGERNATVGPLPFV